MILFITSAALLLWAAWLYWQHVVKPINDEQTTNNTKDAKTFTGLGNSQAVCNTTIIENCPHCNGSGIIELN